MKNAQYSWRNFQIKTIYVKLNVLANKTNIDDNSIGDIIDP